jgi:hypothetical protein
MGFQAGASKKWNLLGAREEELAKESPTSFPGYFLALVNGPVSIFFHSRRWG